MKHNLKIIVIIALLAIPFVLIQILYQHLNPFHLTGRQFLAFFSTQSLCLYLILRLNFQGVEQHGSSFSKLLIIGSFIEGIARVLQGISNHKPVSYLICLMILNAIIYTWILSRRSTPN